MLVYVPKEIFDHPNIIVVVFVIIIVVPNLRTELFGSRPPLLLALYRRFGPGDSPIVQCLRLVASLLESGLLLPLFEPVLPSGL